MAARLKTGDLVVVISGKNKGKQGKIARILADNDRVVVEGVNLIKRHLKPTARTPQGGILEKEAPLHASKVMPVDPKTGKPTRVRFTTDAKGNKTRIAVKSGDELPNKSREGKQAKTGSAE
jgi:large subunit ribosomal protein L24